MEISCDPLGTEDGSMSVGQHSLEGAPSPVEHAVFGRMSVELGEGATAEAVRDKTGRVKTLLVG